MKKKRYRLRPTVLPDGWMDGAKPQVAPVRKVTEQKLTKANFSYPLLIEHYTQPPLGCKPQPKQIITC